MTPLTCAFGRPWPVDPAWTGQHHCAACAMEVALGSHRFRAAGAAGTYDAQGYTPADRRAQARKAAVA